MYTLLIVDDEEYAVLGITKGIDWSDLGISRILTAGSTHEAKELFCDTTVHVMICDIEMPGSNGLELLSWIKENSPETYSIFLTGHANFNYAQKAVQLGCLDYLLKPVDFIHLKHTVEKALKLLQEERSKTEAMEAYRKYQAFWESRRMDFAEHYWQDILSGKASVDLEQTLETLFILEPRVQFIHSFLLVMVKVEQWQEALEPKKREVLHFAIRKFASEALLQESPGCVFQDHDGNILVLAYLADDNKSFKINIGKNSNQFIEACNKMMNCSLSCYISPPATLNDLPDVYHSLVRVGNNNVTHPNNVFHANDLRRENKGKLKVPQMSEWLVLFETGKQEILISKIHDFLYSLANSHDQKELLDSFGIGIVNMLYSVLHKNNLLVEDVFPQCRPLEESTQLTSIQQSFDWACSKITATMEACSLLSHNGSAIVSAVKAYISRHILDDFTRDDIAGALHFNADYLSRVFKKETGSVLSDYILMQRISIARKLLEETNDKISDIARNLGYNHFSHFARIFKNSVGITPQEYRMKYRKIL